jgi:oligopeptide transport system ATP-binding protein
MFADTILEVDHLSKHFPVKRGIVFQRLVGAIQAVDDVSFVIRRGETLGLVGESGCGKSTLGRTILQLYRPTAGKVLYLDTDLTTLRGTKLRSIRRHLQIIFQDPYASLDPRMSIGRIIAAPLVIHGIGNSTERTNRVYQLLELVGLSPTQVHCYPHEFSGGQRQRVAVARALALEPAFIVCDEPISSLDVSIQAQIVNLLGELRDRLNLTYLFISHDLSMIRYISDRVAVMYLGKLVELAPRDDLYSHPLHPYTKALLSAVPIPNPIQERQRSRIVLGGDVPNPANPPDGCRFHTRCPVALNICGSDEPQMRQISHGHWVSCHMT